MEDDVCCLAARISSLQGPGTWKAHRTSGAGTLLRQSTFKKVDWKLKKKKSYCLRQNLKMENFSSTYLQLSTCPMQQQQFEQIWCCHKQTPQLWLSALRHFWNCKTNYDFILNSCVLSPNQIYSVQQCTSTSALVTTMASLCTRGQWQAITITNNNNKNGNPNCTRGQR